MGGDIVGPRTRVKGPSSLRAGLAWVLIPNGDAISNRHGVSECVR